jgi:hypothetical protein
VDRCELRGYKLQMNLFEHYRISKAAQYAEEASDSVKGLEEEVHYLRLKVADMHKLLEAFILAQMRKGIISEADFKSAYEEATRAPELAPGPGVQTCSKCGRSSPMDWATCMYCDEPFHPEVK